MALNIPHSHLEPNTAEVIAQLLKQLDEADPGGQVAYFIGTVAPSGWGLMDGTTVTDCQTRYPSTWANAAAGLKSGSDLVLPDTRRRVPVNLLDSDSAFDTIGETGGATTHAHSLTGANVQALIALISGTGIVERRRTTSAWTETHLGTSTISTGSTSRTVGTDVEGTTETGSSWPPYIVLSQIIRLR